METFTFVGIFPFFCHLDLFLCQFHKISKISAFVGGSTSNLPSVNIHPCLLNINPLDNRGSSVTIANLIINVSRGIRPSIITMFNIILGLNRKFSFNTLITTFWIIASLILLTIIYNLPRDQDKMNKEFARYAESEHRLKRDDTTTSQINAKSSCSFDCLNRNIWFTCVNEIKEKSNGDESIIMLRSANSLLILEQHVKISHSSDMSLVI